MDSEEQKIKKVFQNYSGFGLDVPLGILFFFFAVKLMISKNQKHVPKKEERKKMVNYTSSQPIYHKTKAGNSKPKSRQKVQKIL